jgi:acyl-CoA synthetase (AMP-forming)/AMP-acid ligase II
MKQNSQLNCIPLILHEIIKSCEKNPDKIAITECLHKELEVNTKYQQINNKSSQLAYLLKEKKVKNNLIGIFMNRNAEHVISMIAALKSDKTFITINTKYKTYQLTKIIKDSKISLLLVDNSGLIQSSKLDQNILNEITIIHYDQKEMSPFQKKIFDRLQSVSTVISEDYNSDCTHNEYKNSQHFISDDPAFVLYTSGSTGDPKGVLISNQNLYHRTVSECKTYKISADDTILNLLPFSFDVGLNQLFSSLCSGANLVISHSWMTQDINRLIKQHSVTGISAVLRFGEN